MEACRDYGSGSYSRCAAVGIGAEGHRRQCPPIAGEQGVAARVAGSPGVAFHAAGREVAVAAPTRRGRGTRPPGGSLLAGRSQAAPAPARTLRRPIPHPAEPPTCSRRREVVTFLAGLQRPLPAAALKRAMERACRRPKWRNDTAATSRRRAAWRSGETWRSHARRSAAPAGRSGPNPPRGAGAREGWQVACRRVLLTHGRLRGRGGGAIARPRRGLRLRQAASGKAVLAPAPPPRRTAQAPFRCMQLKHRTMPLRDATGRGSAGPRPPYKRT
jgi:hypothetical protein